MTTPLFFRSVAPTITPDRVILDTTALIKTLRTKLQQLHSDQLKEDLLSKEDRLVELLVEALQFNNMHLELELAVTCTDVLRSEFGICEDDLEHVAHPLFDFGLGLYEIMQKLKAYQRGYMFYQFSQMLGPDVVIMRIMPPNINA